MEEDAIDEDDVDWRWQYVAALVEENKAPSRRPEDDIFRTAWHYLKRYRTNSKAEKLTLRHDYPVLYKAHQLHRNVLSERWIIEAGLLTNLPVADLAKYVSQPTEVVSAYSQYFFDVRPRLEARGYILNRVLMPSFKRGMNQRDHDLMFKTFAYCAGWDMFCEFIDRKQLSGEARSFFNSTFKDNLVKLSVMATQRIEVNNYNATQIMELNLRLMELDKATGAVGSEAQVESLLATLLSNCKFALLSSKEPPPLNEPRAVELLGNEKLLRYGEEIPHTGKSYKLLDVK